MFPSWAPIQTSHALSEACLPAFSLWKRTGRTVAEPYSWLERPRNANGLLVRRYQFRALRSRLSQCQPRETSVSERVLSQMPNCWSITMSSIFTEEQYWLDHQKDDLGYPDIHTRARNDLTERNLHWLKALLKYRLPPAQVIELGCARRQLCRFDAAGRL